MRDEGCFPLAALKLNRLSTPPTEAVFCVRLVNLLPLGSSVSHPRHLPSDPLRHGSISSGAVRLGPRCFIERHLRHGIEPVVLEAQ